jgi:hypothetical protein
MARAKPEDGGSHGTGIYPTAVRAAHGGHGFILPTTHFTWSYIPVGVIAVDLSRMVRAGIKPAPAAVSQQHCRLGTGADRALPDARLCAKRIFGTESRAGCKVGGDHDAGRILIARLYDMGVGMKCRSFE